MDRREFVKRSLFLTLGMATGLVSQAQGKKNNISLPYKVTGWSGNEFALPHRFRDGWVPNTKPIESKHDVVVIGAGICGLVMAYQLRDRDLLVLESEATVGGNAKAGKYLSTEFNIGSAYFNNGHPESEQGKLLSELDISLEPVLHPTDYWHYQGNWCDAWDDGQIARYPEDLRKAFQGFKKALQEIVASPDFPQSPYQTSTAKALALDKITFAQWLQPYAHPDLIRLINCHCNAALNAPCETISAYAGIHCCSELLGHIYSAREGNSQIAKALVNKIAASGKNRIHTAAFVYKIVPVAKDLAQVFYLRMGRHYVAQAKQVILAVPYFQAARMIADLASGQRNLLNAQRYGAYIVANLRFKQQIVEPTAYHHWNPHLGGVFEDFIPVDKVPASAHSSSPTNPLSNPPNAVPPTNSFSGQIITMFAPCRNPVWGRMRMISEGPEIFAQEIVEAFCKLYPHAQQHLEEVYMTRWGHAMMMNRPGVFTQWLPLLQKQIGPISLVHSDGQGFSSIETAISEALRMFRKV